MVALEQRLKASRSKVRVVGKCAAYSQSSHHEERDLIDDAGATCFVAIVGSPRL